MVQEKRTPISTAPKAPLTDSELQQASDLSIMRKVIDVAVSAASSLIPSSPSRGETEELDISINACTTTSTNPNPNRSNPTHPTEATLPSNPNPTLSSSPMSSGEREDILLKGRNAKPLRENRTQKRLPWTTAEEQALLIGVRDLGKGNWARILERYPQVFHSTRTNIDLKDKFRNLHRQIERGNSPAVANTAAASAQANERRVHIVDVASAAGSTSWCLSNTPTEWQSAKSEDAEEWALMLQEYEAKLRVKLLLVQAERERSRSEHFQDAEEGTGALIDQERNRNSVDKRMKNKRSK